ncbi:MAG: putative Ig domain-containing protein [Kiritimatiellales bacterium]
MKKINEMMMTAVGSNSRAFSGIRRRLVIFSIFFLGFLICASVQAVTLSDNAGLQLEMGTNGIITSVTLNGVVQPSGTGGGFYLMDTNSSTEVFMTGAAPSGGNLHLTSSSLNATLDAVITQGNGYIEVAGTLASTTGSDRGLWLGFNVPVDTTGWKWGHNLSGTNKVITSAALGYTKDDSLLIPIPAVWNANGGISLCIPPTDPCVFENSADAGGVRIRMAYGLSSITTNFPSAAPFRFRIYSIDGTWGFRDALAKYYDWYPDYYTLEPGIMKRLNHNRYWFTMNYENEAPSKNDQANLTFPDMGQWCAYGKLTARPQGMTGVENLSPTNTKGYLAAIATCTDIMEYGRKLPVNDPSLVEARAAISNCVAYHPDGTWSMQDPPAAGTLDIGCNVSPNLFNDAAHTNWSVYADMYLRRSGKLLGSNTNFAYMHWDVTGGRSMIVNYRREHFAYTKHPLTFDQLGRLCLPTQFSNYELFDAYRLMAKQGDMWHEGAGMQSFGAKTATELLGGQDRVGMHFLASQMASAWNEGGEKYHAISDYDLYRIYMGRKSYRISYPDTGGNVLADIKRALAICTAFGFSSCNDSLYFMTASNPNYDPALSLFYTPAHQAVWTNYIPANEAIRLAGWEPVTHAFCTNTAVVVQRFGHGTNIYLTVWGPTNLPATVDIDIEAAALGLAANPAFKELISNTPMTITNSARGWKLTVPLQQDVTRVIKMTGGATGNSPPVFTADPISKASVTVGVPYTGQTLAGSATDANGDTLTYSKVSGPAWLSIASGGALSGTPAGGDAGANSWTVQVSDGKGGTDTAILNIQVMAGSYTLTVNNGTGGGSFTNGTVVAIAANAPAAGKAFDHWIGDTQYVDNASSLNTTVTMPAQAVALTATYADVNYSLTINYGTGGGGTYTNGARVAIAANAPAAGKAFDKWIGDTQYVDNASSLNTTVTMPAQAVSLTATYVDVYYALTVTGGTGGGSFTNGARVAISANAPTSGKAFSQWVGDTQVVNTTTNMNALVTMSTNAVSLTATYMDVYYALTVNSGTGDGSYTNGTRVAIAADVIAGKTFAAWIGDTQVVASVSSSNTTVTIPTQAIALTATYVDTTYALTVNSGTGGGGTHTNGARVAIAANAPAAGKAFDHWIGDTQYVDNASSLNTTVTMPAQAVALTATYADVNYSLTINYGTGGGLSYTNEQKVAILANTPAAGKAFDKWTGDTQYLDDATNASTWMTMPARDVVLTATYVDVYYALTVNSGTGGGSYTNGTQVDISADAPAEGQTFDHWTGDTQYAANSNSASTTVTMPAQAIALTATYKLDSVTLMGQGSIGGSVSPTSTNVPIGYPVTFVITASNYYRIAAVFTNGGNIGVAFNNNSTNYTLIWSNVTAVTVAAAFTNQVTTNAPAQVPYKWMAQYGLTNSGATFDQAAAVDQDGDGLTAWQEYIAGTDPTNTTSGFRAVQNNRNVITWSPVSGRVYSVYWSTNLMSGFQCLESNIPWTQGGYTNASPNSRVNHYQIKVRMQ